MCGRYSMTAKLSELQKRFGFKGGPELPARYNIAPSQACPVVVAAGGNRRLELMAWGLGERRSINARAETLLLKPTFREPFKERRCLVLADSFYEWKGREPVRFALKTGEPFAMAGLYSPEKAFAVITTEPNELIRPIHDRMPVLLDPEDEALWLDPGAGPELLTAALKPAPAARLRLKPASPALNKAGHEGPDCWENRQAELF